MKKINKDQYLYIKSQQKILILKARRRRIRKLKEKENYPLYFTKINKGRTLKAPSTFCLHDQPLRSRLLNFLAELRESVVKKELKTIIDFSGTQKMVAGGTLLFVAELRRIIRLKSEGVTIHCAPPRNKKVLQVLQQIGALKLMRFPRRVPTTYRDVIHWRFAWGSQVLGQKYDEILGHYDGKLSLSLAEGFYHGLTEAMTNCRQHAYIRPRQDGLGVSGEPTEWWMFSQEKDQHLHVVFCDLGIGIPATLPIKKPVLWRKLISAFGQVTDGQAIFEAVAESKTRTGKSYRGKGLKQLLEVVQEARGSALIVYSNRGCFTYNDGVQRHFNFKDSISGTLIAWKIPIPKSEGDHLHAND